MNTSSEVKKVDLAKDCKERTQGFKSCKDVINNTQKQLQIEVPAMSMQVLELN